jgi:hypothetical protein
MKSSAGVLRLLVRDSLAITDTAVAVVSGFSSSACSLAYVARVLNSQGRIRRDDRRS